MFYVKTWISDHINDLTGHNHQHQFLKNCEKCTAALDCTENVTGMKTEYSIVSFNEG